MDRTNGSLDLDIAWDLILGTYRTKCKDASMHHTEGFSLFIFKNRTSYLGSVRYNCIYKYISKGSFFWNTHFEKNKKLMELHKPLENYMICISIHRDEDTESSSIVKLYDMKDDREIVCDT